MLVDHRLTKQSLLMSDKARQSNYRFRKNRVLFVRHCRGSAAAVQSDLIDPLLRHKGDILADLAKTARNEREPVTKSNHRCPVRVPHWTDRQSKSLRHVFSHGLRMIYGRVTFPGCATDLNLREIFFQQWYPALIDSKRTQPGCHAQSNSRRNSGLHPRARHEWHIT